MPTPSIQTLRNDAQQVLNLDSISAVRSVVAASLANANAGTPLNPNLTTQQLWNEFYQIVTQPKSDIESIIANQLMKFLYAPPAPGGAGADKQVIFNDGGVLAGDPGLTYNKTTDTLTIGTRLLVGVSNAATVGNPAIGVVGGALYDGQFNLIGNFTNDNTSAAKGVLLGFNNTTNNGIIAAAYGNGTEGLTFWTHNGIGWGQRMELNATGQVGIGMSPSNNLSIGSATYASFGVKIDSITQSSLIFKGTPDAAGYEHAKIVSGRESSPFTYGSFLAFYTEGKNSGTTDTSVERARFNSTGNLAFANGLGIDFSATASGSGTMTSELLNDYEEGTFTPTVRGSTVAGTGVYTSQNGFYTKVGRLVTVSVNLSWTAVTSGTGNLQFGGLPFIASNTLGAYNGISIAYVNNIATSAGTVLYGLVEYGTTLITMTQTPTGGGTYGLVPLDTSGDIAFTATYFV